MWLMASVRLVGYRAKKNANQTQKKQDDRDVSDRDSDPYGGCDGYKTHDDWRRRNIC